MKATRIERLAHSLNNFMRNYDPYEYDGQYTSESEGFGDILNTIINNDLAPINEVLNNALEESNDIGLVASALILKEELNYV